MRIGLNLLHAHIGIGGGWNYISRLVSALGEFDQENEYVCYCTPESECLMPRKPNFLKRKAKFSGTNRIKRILYENTILPIHAKKDKLDCLHWFAINLGFFCPVPSVVTIYDMLMYDMPELYPVAHQVYKKAMISRAVKSANVLAPMSQSTANTLARILKANRDRMVIIPPMIADEYKPVATPEVDIFRTKYGLPDKFWLYVAHFHPYKNHARLFQAYAQMKACACAENNWPLVLRGEKNGADDVIARLLDENGMAADVIWLPRLSDGEIPLLFSSASALVFPSMYEGGGMPVMEAMACGCPVAASTIPTNLEFAGDAALLFDPTHVEAIAESMKILGTDSELREKFRQLGLAKVENLRPRNVVKLLVSTYQKTYGK